MKFYCAACFEEEGNCQLWCEERQRQELLRRSANSLGELHTTHCNCVACAAVKARPR